MTLTLSICHEATKEFLHGGLQRDIQPFRLELEDPSGRWIKGGLNHVRKDRKRIDLPHKHPSRFKVCGGTCESIHAESSKPHLDCVTRIQRHVKSTSNFGLWYDASTQVGLSGYIDAN